MSDKKSTNKDVIMFMKNFEVQEANQPLDRKEIRIGIKSDSKKTTKQIQILIVFFSKVC